MKVLFDARAVDGRPSGVRDIASGLLGGLRTLTEEGLVELVVVAGPGTTQDAEALRGRGFMQVQLPLARVRHRADRIVIPRQTMPVLSADVAVPLFLDIGFLRRPDLYPKSGVISATTRLAALSRRSLALSSYTAREMSEFGIGRRVTPLPIGALHDVRWEPDQDNPYLLCVASQEPHKNIPRLLRSWDIAETGTTSLVICGREGRDTPEVMRTLRGMKKESSVHLRSGVAHDQYQRLLARCWGYIQPSFYEGLCIPAMDMAAAGAPISVSRESILGEYFAGSESRQTFDPLSESEIATSITGLLSDAQFRKSASRFAHEVVKLTDWKAVAHVALQGMQ